MEDPFTSPTRRPRADAVRNRERVLEAAKVVFSAGGAAASLEAVAKEAGVGIGTLYRHFPTRETLFEAVYRREVDQLADLLARSVRLRRRADVPIGAFLSGGIDSATIVSLLSRGTPAVNTFSIGTRSQTLDEAPAARRRD